MPKMSAADPVLQLQRAYSQAYYAQAGSAEARALFRGISCVVSRNLPAKAALDKITAKTKRICQQPVIQRAALEQLKAIQVTAYIGKLQYSVKAIVEDWIEKDANAQFIADRINDYLANCPDGVTHLADIDDARVLRSLSDAGSLLSEDAERLLQQEDAHQLASLAERVQALSDDVKLWYQRLREGQDSNEPENQLIDTLQDHLVVTTSLFWDTELAALVTALAKSKQRAGITVSGLKLRRKRLGSRRRKPAQTVAEIPLSSAVLPPWTKPTRLRRAPRAADPDIKG